MKTAEEWCLEYRATNELVMIDPVRIRAIQADALRHAAELCITEPDSVKHFRLIIAEAKRLEAKP